MAAKLKDALFLGDFEAAQDLEFIVANKITRVINCAGREIANAWERSGVRYLTFYWPEGGNAIIFDESNSVLDEIYSFIEEALEGGDSVLVHSTDGVSRASFCACVYFMLKYRWALSKTLKYLQSKRPDLCPRPGFMRQLQALDASLQKVTKAAGRDAAMRRYTEWDAAVVASTGADPATEDELLLTNTYINSQPVSEEVIIAAQSSTPMPRAPVAPPSHPQGSVHFATQVTTIAGQLAQRPGSAPAAGALGKKPGGSGISWIDDPRRSGTTHSDVPVSPTTRRPTMERPPGSSYSSLAIGAGWTDNSAGTVSVTVASPNGTLSTAKVLPTITGSVSAAAAHIPGAAASSPSKIKSALKGGGQWMLQHGMAPASSSQAAESAAKLAASGVSGARNGRSTPVEGKESDSKLDSERSSKLAADSLADRAANRRPSAGSLSARSHSSSSLIEDGPARAPSPATGGFYATTAAVASTASSTAYSSSSSQYGSMSTTGGMRPASPSMAGRSGADALSRGAATTVTSGSVAATAAQLQRSAIASNGPMLSATSTLTSTLNSTSLAGKAAAAVRPGMAMGAGGPVKATAAALPVATAPPGRPGTAGYPASLMSTGGTAMPSGTNAALSSLSGGNFSRSLATSSLASNSLESVDSASGGLPAATGTMPRLGGASATTGVPPRTASSRVRGYSPGPGKARERAAATAASKQNAMAPAPAPAPAASPAAAMLASSSYAGGYAATSGGYATSSLTRPGSSGGAASLSASYVGHSAISSQYGGGMTGGVTTATVGSALTTPTAASSARGRTASPSARPQSATLAPVASTNATSLGGSTAFQDASFGPTGYVRSSGLSGSMKLASGSPAASASKVPVTASAARAGTPTRPVSAQPLRGASPGPDTAGRVPDYGAPSGLASSAFLSSTGGGSSYLGGSFSGSTYGSSIGGRGGFMQYGSAAPAPAPAPATRPLSATTAAPARAPSPMASARMGASQRRF